MPHARINPRTKFPGRRVVVDLADPEAIAVVQGAIKLTGFDGPRVETSVRFVEVTEAHAAQLRTQAYHCTSAGGTKENPFTVEMCETAEEARAIEAADVAWMLKLAAGKRELVLSDGK